MKLNKNFTPDEHYEMAQALLSIKRNAQFLSSKMRNRCPKSGKLWRKISSLRIQASSLSSQLEEKFYHDCPDFAKKVGFPHYKEDSLLKMYDYLSKSR